jgi:hypothetical protein
MKLVAILFFSMGFVSQATLATPIEKVVQMLGDLETKIIGEGTDAQKVYDEYSEFCEDRSKNVGFEIKTGQAEVKDLEAAIANEAAKSESLTAKIEDFASAISVDEADLKAATEIRAKEQAAFEAEEKELVEVIGTLERAIGILEKEMAKGGASMMQLKSASSVTQALSIMVEAASLNSESASKLASFLQNDQEEDDMGAPAAAVYKGHSDGIIGTMQDLYEKAEAQLEKARSAETKSVQAYQMLAQSLKDEIKYATKDMNKAKKELGASAEATATAEGDLSVTSKHLE